MKREMDQELEVSGGKGSRRPRRSTGVTNISMPCVLKLLTPAELAAAVIGKGGSVIAQLRQAYGAKLGLTDHSEFYPQTSCRILTAQTSTEESMGLVLSQIIAKIGELVTAGNQSEDIGSVGEVKLRMLVPKAAVGGVIGKGGSNIKQLRDSTGAKVSISEPSSSGPGVDQVISIAGTPQAVEAVSAEVNRQIQALNTEGWFLQWASVPGHESYGSMAPSRGGGCGYDWSAAPQDHLLDPSLQVPTYDGYQPVTLQKAADPSSVHTLVNVAQTLPSYVMEDPRGFAMNCVVPNSLVGGLIGRGGAGTKEVQAMTGTKIGIRDIPGDPEHRTLNIAGPLANTCSAYMLMMKRYLDSEAQMAT